MVLYHLIRSVLCAYLAIPFILIGNIFYFFSEIFFTIADAIWDDWSFLDLNPIKKYKNIKKNINSDEFHKWTGRRIK